jgi:hypothetical protein
MPGRASAVRPEPALALGRISRSSSWRPGASRLKNPPCPRDPAAVRDQLATAGAGHRAVPRAQPVRSQTPDPTVVPQERQGNASQARR